MKARNTQRINTELASVAIMQAVNDIETIEKLEAETGQWCIAMNQWHGVVPDLDAPVCGGCVCGVCMGGAMLARVYGYVHAELSPGESLLDEGEREVVAAMDNIREVDPTSVEVGLDQLGVPDEVAVEAISSVLGGDNDFTTYDDSPDDFKRERLALATELARLGY